MWDAITACTLAEVRANGDIVDGGTTGLRTNPGSFKLHSALRTLSRESDIAWVMHTHYRACVAVSYMPQRLLPISAFADNLSTIAYTDFQLATAGWVYDHDVWDTSVFDEQFKRSQL